MRKKDKNQSNATPTNGIREVRSTDLFYNVEKNFVRKLG